MSSDIADPVLAALLADVEASQARLHAYLALCSAPPDASDHVSTEWPASPGHPNLVTVAEAALRASCSSDTIIRWCKTAGIGKMYGTRWRVSLKRLDAKTAAKH